MMIYALPSSSDERINEGRFYGDGAMEIKYVSINEPQINQARNEQSAESISASNKSRKESAGTSPVVTEPAMEPPIQTTAVFVIDDSENVVIQLIDEKGDIIRQIPPEEYINMVKKLKGLMESHYDIEI